MKKWAKAVLIASLMVPWSESIKAAGDLYSEELYDLEEYKEYIEKVEKALGVFHDIEVFEQVPTKNDPRKMEWQLKPGPSIKEFIPVTVDDKKPADYHKDMRSDRPMMLPTRVEGFDGGDGQSSPYTVVGRMPGSNPEVQWVFLVRQYSIKKLTDDNFAESGDMAVIGHHPRTGASIYLQFYRPDQPKSSKVVVSPFSKPRESNKQIDDRMKFWAPLQTIATSYLCQRCHNADPFIHTPWIDQVRVHGNQKKDGDEENRNKDPFPEPMVPSNPFGPFFFVDSDYGGLFAGWNDKLSHLNNPDNKCTQCHRVTPYDMIGLYQNSTQYAGVVRTERNEFSVEANGFQTEIYRLLQWMPPATQDNFDFYAGQQDVKDVWHEVYEESASEVNRLALAAGDVDKGLSPQDARKLSPVPRPPAEYREIVVDRPDQDMIAGGQSLWILDRRIRANTDADLDQWRFFGKGAADSGIEARPVVYRRTPDGKFDVVFVGAPRGLDSAENWVPVGEDQTVELKLGDYLGAVLTNPGTKSAEAIIPFTRDEWARPVWSKDGLRFDLGTLDQYVTYQATDGQPPAEGAQLDFGNPDLRTYSFEFRNRL